MNPEESKLQSCKPAKTITIMADFGFAPYAWLKDSSDKTSYVGGNIADSTSGFPDDIPVSETLERDLADWASHYDADSLERGFDWHTHNSRGLELSRRLKQEVGDAFRVIYREEYPEPVSHRQIEVNSPQ